MKFDTLFISRTTFLAIESPDHFKCIANAITHYWYNVLS